MLRDDSDVAVVRGVEHGKNAIYKWLLFDFIMV